MSAKIHEKPSHSWSGPRDTNGSRQMPFLLDIQYSTIGYRHGFRYCRRVWPLCPSYKISRSFRWHLRQTLSKDTIRRGSASQDYIKHLASSRPPCDMYVVNVYPEIGNYFKPSSQCIITATIATRSFVLNGISLFRRYRIGFMEKGTKRQAGKNCPKLKACYFKKSLLYSALAM